MKKVLIITYYWPPSGGSGVQRWLKFAKYLPEYGWEPIILTPENPSFINSDPSLIPETEGIEVLKIPIWEPYQLAQKITGRKIHQKDVVLTGKLSLKQKISVWIRGNWFIPDPRKFWTKPVVEFLKHYLKDSEVNTIITTGPPHSLHLIGLKLKRKLGVRWIADFRDPWSEWDVLETFRLTKRSFAKHRRQEQMVIKEADKVISVGWHMNYDLQRLGARNPLVITNGFDPSDFENLAGEKSNPDEFIIRHIGSIDDQRDPRPFLHLISSLEIPGKSIKFEFVGNINPKLLGYVNEDPNLSKVVSFREYVPHNEVIKLYKDTDLLLLVLAHSQSAKLNITGKIFEYIASGTPVIGIGDPEGDAARVLKESGRGKVFTPSDNEGMKVYLDEISQGYMLEDFDLHNSPFSRRVLTGKLAELLNN